MKKRKNWLTIRMVCAVYLLYLSYKLIRQLAAGEMSGKSFVVGVICVVVFILFGIFCIVTTWIELKNIDKQLKEEQEKEASSNESAQAALKKSDPSREELRHAGEAETQSARIARLNALVEASMDDEEEDEEEKVETDEIDAVPSAESVEPTESVEPAESCESEE